MRDYRNVLSTKLKEAELTQKEIATRMGWASQSTVSEKLKGKRDWSEGELTRMCEIAGITILWLADNSDDLRLSANRSTIEIAVLLDSLSEVKRQGLLSFLCKE